MIKSERPRLSEADLVAQLAALEIPTLPRQLFGGYSREATNALLARAATAIQALRAQADDVESEPPDPLSAESTRDAVGNALITAHQAAERVRDEAHRDADALRETAKAEAARITEEARVESATAQAELVSLRAELAQLRGLADEFETRWHVVTESVRQLGDLTSAAAEAQRPIAALSSDLLLNPALDGEFGDMRESSE